ncbi:MAG: hypothetical protein AB7L92_02155 [Alphaproteobacteria bacterium]
MRSLLIGFALLVPVFVIVALSGKIKPAPDVYHDEKKSGEIASKMKPLPELDNEVPDFIAPGSLAEAKLRLKRRLAELDKMTEAEWKKQRTDRENFKEKWNKLTDEQKQQAIEKMREKKAEEAKKEAPPPQQTTPAHTATERAPEIPGEPAQPMADFPKSSNPAD